MTGPRMNHVEARSNKRPARQYVSETHDHKPDAPTRSESRSAAKHTAGTAAGAQTVKKELDLIIQAKECLETAIKLYECPNGNCNTVVQAIHWTNKARATLAEIGGAE